MAWRSIGEVEWNLCPTATGSGMIPHVTNNPSKPGIFKSEEGESSTSAHCRVVGIVRTGLSFWFVGAAPFLDDNKKPD